ncbi:MAG: efflux transporter outer membrane subunit [Gemmatimonadaceae bacterium]
MTIPFRSLAVAVALVAATRSALAQRAAPAEFWLALGDTTLVRLVSETRVANRDIQIASARADGARATRTGAALELLPIVTTRGGYTRQRIASASFPGASGAFPDQNVWDAGLALSWEVDVTGRLRHSVRGRGALAEAAAEDVRDVELALTAHTANAYLTLRGAQERLAVARRNAENQRRTLEITQRRLEAGRGTQLDTERAKSQLSATLAAIPTLEATIEGARQRIRVLTGRSRLEDVALPPCETSVELPEVGELTAPDQVIRDRPDVRSAERQAAASTAFVGAVRADYLPKLSLQGAAGYTGSEARALGNTGTPRYVIGPVLSWPAFDLGRVRANVAAARAEEAQSRASYELVVARAQEELESSVVAYRKARERLQYLEDAASASARAAELARLRYTEGGSDFFQVLDAERTLLERENERAFGRTEAETNLIAVYRALGGANAFTAGAKR